MRYQYKYKFYINASHYVMLKGKKGDIHSHCFELVIELLAQEQAESSMERASMLSFTEVEQVIENALSKYQNVLLNEIWPFDQISPTLENLCVEFKKLVEEVLKGQGWTVLSTELSETPTRSFIIVSDII